MITLNPLLNRVRVKYIVRVNRFTINPVEENEEEMLKAG